LTVGANIHASSRPQSICPPSHPRNAVDWWSGAVASHIIGVWPVWSHRLEWMWHDEPTSSTEYFAMNVIERPSCDAISLAPFL
jgi:hypothetical protein